MTSLSEIREAVKIGIMAGPRIGLSNISDAGKRFRTDTPISHAEIYDDIFNRLKSVGFGGHSLKNKSIYRLPRIWNAFIATKDVPGDIVEFGVFEGIITLMLAAGVKSLGLNKRVYAFDSWEGLPLPSAIDADCFKAGAFETPFEAFQIRADALEVGEIVQVRQGWFEDTLSAGALEKPFNGFSFAHLDADLYDSTRVCLNFVSNRMNQGSVLRFDEVFHPGPNRASMEFFGCAREFFAF